MRRQQVGGTTVVHWRQAAACRLSAMHPAMRGGDRGDRDCRRCRLTSGVREEVPHTDVAAVR